MGKRQIQQSVDWTGGGGGTVVVVVVVVVVVGFTIVAGMGVGSQGGMGDGLMVVAGWGGGASVEEGRTECTPKLLSLLSAFVLFQKKRVGE